MNYTFHPNIYIVTTNFPGFKNNIKIRNEQMENKYPSKNGPYCIIIYK